MRLHHFALASSLLFAACTAPAPATPAAVAPDTDAMRVALDPFGASYKAATLAGDAAALNALYTDNAVVELSNQPTAVGRAAILKADSAQFATIKFSDWNINIRGTTDLGGGRAAQSGTFWSKFADKKGAKMSQYGRWVAGFMKGDDAKWRINYLMGMTDSLKPTK